MQQWQCKTDLQRRCKLAAIDVSNAELIKQECDVRLPCRDVQCPEHLGSHIHGCARGWAEKRCVATEELYHVYWIDMTIPGHNYNRSALSALGVLSAGLASSPERAVGIMFAPNTGPYGMQYTDEGVRKAIDDIEKLLGDTSLNLTYREFDLFSTRPPSPSSPAAQAATRGG